MTGNNKRFYTLFTEVIQHIELQILMNLTAKALRVPTISIWRLNHIEGLRCYAEFTRDNLSDNVTPEVLQRMNTQAYRLGRKLRLIFFVTSQASAQKTIVKLYRNIGIQMSFKSDNHICFHSCFFSHFYSPDVCQAASSLDDGIIRGITGCGHLTFEQRITEKCNYCLAQYKHEEKSNCNR